MRRWIVLGVLVMVASASAGTLASSDSARWPWSYTFAAACPTGEPAPDCVTESPETVEDAWLDDTGVRDAGPVRRDHGWRARGRGGVDPRRRGT